MPSLLEFCKESEEVICHERKAVNNSKEKAEHLISCLNLMAAYKNNKAHKTTHWVSVPLPEKKQEKLILALPDNKGDFARFLSEYITEKATQKILIAAGGFEDAMEVRS